MVMHEAARSLSIHLAQHDGEPLKADLTAVRQSADIWDVRRQLGGFRRNAAKNRKVVVARKTTPHLFFGEPT